MKHNASDVDRQMSRQPLECPSLLPASEALAMWQAEALRTGSDSLPVRISGKIDDCIRRTAFARSAYAAAAQGAEDWRAAASPASAESYARDGAVAALRLLGSGRGEQPPLAAVGALLSASGDGPPAASAVLLDAAQRMLLSARSTQLLLPAAAEMLPEPITGSLSDEIAAGMHRAIRELPAQAAVVSALASQLREAERLLAPAGDLSEARKRSDRAQARLHATGVGEGSVPLWPGTRGLGPVRIIAAALLREARRCALALAQTHTPLRDLPALARRARCCMDAAEALLQGIARQQSADTQEGGV